MKWQLIKKVPVDHKKIVPNFVAFLKPEIYIELGIYQCVTFNRCAEALPPQGKAFGVDISAEARQYMKSKKARFHQESTADFFKKWDCEIRLPIDLIFIDADHHKESAFQEALSFWKYLKEDTGLMILHDTWPLNPEDVTFDKSGDVYLVPKMIKSALPSDQAEVLTLPADSGLTLVRKLGKDWRNGS